MLLKASYVGAARKHGAWYRWGPARSTPHLVDARDKIINTASSVRSRWWRFAAITTCAGQRSADTRRRIISTMRLWTGPAPMRPYNALVHPRSWRAFHEYGNGIIGDMCIHMFDMTRWMLNLGWPKRSAPRAEFWCRKAVRPT